MKNEVTKPLVIMALRKSRVKRKILEYLIANGCGYVSEMARYVNVTPTNVIGAVRGMNERYKVCSSLVTLGLVKEVKMTDDYRIRIYCITPLGKEAVKMCRINGG
jgi:predicted transcriptional regulator with HTH domain